MERSEPTLVPEWLRSTGSVTGGSNSNHHFPSSSSHSDVPSLSQSRNRISKTTGDFDTSRSAFLDRTSSSNSRRSSSNGSSKHAYSSFNRGHRDKDREKEKDRLNFGDSWDRDSPDPLGKILSNKIDKDALRRSHSMVSRKLGERELFHRRAATELKNHNNSNGILSGTSVSSSIQKAVFEKDFPSLGSEEKQGASEIGRVSSPGLSSPVQSLPIGNSALIVGGEGWTSALAEVPSMIGSTTGSSSFQQTVPATSGAGPLSVTAGLNMAEALVQAPSRARATPQLSVKTQRLEELAIKQSRQLIPVTPSMTKAMVLNPSDKSKPKLASRTGELNVTIKGGQQQPLSVHANQSRGGLVKSDAQKSAHGKFLVLKPVRENGISLAAKDVSSPTSNANSMAVNSQFALASAVAHAPLRSPNNTNVSSVERKIASLDLKSGTTLEKRPSLSQVQSRNDFFNLIKKKTSMSSAVLSDSCSSVKSPSISHSNELTREETDMPASPRVIENGAVENRNGDGSEEVRASCDTGEKTESHVAAESLDEEEAAFLRSLGWDENCGEDEGLTEEEINSFYREYMNLKPSLKMGRCIKPKIFVPSESHEDSKDGAGSELSSSDSEA
ncbi:mediator of RNA polymerase II transcription subunit 1 isoform X2 [Benincasa hispida]|uniref:mediator of RNA polymerase II transcription subunit 1 isoform X2 n=1 Tax=Benincasa hispida TaxID=102211 RepID=UPI0019002358|nr:mediator of RNA polymerase II transcription subunit 1 isoform X2 [Benincasa hispida]